MKADGFERLLIWTGVNIDSSQIFCLTVFNENQLAALIVSDSEIEIASFKRSTRSELLETTVLNYATLGLRSDVRADIVEFNKTHQNCKIEVHDYSEYNIGEDRSQGISKLNTDLLAGKIDILDTAGLPIRQYGNEGILEDLQPYLSDDLELGKSKLMYHVLETAMQDGKLYQAFPSFSILTAAGSASVVGNRTSWTLEDLAAVLKNMPESCTVFGAGETKEKLFERLFCMEQDNFIDWGTGTCDFTGEEFKNLLEFCNEVSPIYEVEEEEYAWVREGRQLLLPAELCTLYREDYLLYPAVFGESCSFIGYPQQDGSIGSFFRLGDGMAITVFCKNKEAAWSFVRGMFLSRYPTGMYFGDMLPINRTDFNRLIDIVTTPSYKWDETGNILFDENGQPVEDVFIDTPFDSSLEIAIRAITQEELAQLIDLINSIDTVYYFDKNIYSIVMEETGAYFSGDKAVEDVVELIQHRVSLYINESM